MAGTRERTVRPFFNVVVWVLAAADTGVANPRVNGAAERPARALRPLLRFRASLRDAMGEMRSRFVGMSGLSKVVGGLARLRAQENYKLRTPKNKGTNTPHVPLFGPVPNLVTQRLTRP